MSKFAKYSFSLLLLLQVYHMSFAQNKIQVQSFPNQHKVAILVDGKPFTSFLYPDTLEKPVLYPVYSAKGIMVTRSFPLMARAGDATDHPHHIGIWFNYENVNGLDFWNNSYAIPAAKKNLYGWIKTDRIVQTKSGRTGVLAYHANWVNQANDVLLEEQTRLEFSAKGQNRFIDRLTTLTAQTDVTFKDAKDGLLGFRLAHELQIPSTADQKFTDDKGNITIVKGGTDRIANGTYLTSAGKTGDAAWGTTGIWCKAYAKIGADSVSVSIIDHPLNPGYPTYWHARGYGLFAANPLGQKAFSNGKTVMNFHLAKGQQVTFRYRIIISDGNKTITPAALDKLATAFAKTK